MQEQEYVVPSNEDAERALICAAMLDSEAVAEVVGIVRPEDMFARSHQQIWASILALFEAGQGIDPITISAHLERGGKKLPQAAIDYLADLLATVATAAHARFHARLIRDCAIRRQVAHAGATIRLEALDPGGEAAGVLEVAQARLAEIGEDRAGREAVTISEAAVGVLDVVKRASDSKGSITGISTGFASLDAMTSGWQKGEAVVIAARPSMGKTALATAMAKTAATAGETVVIFSLEMSKEQLTIRNVAQESKIPLQRLRRGLIRASEWSRLAYAYTELRSQSIVVDDTSGLTTGEMRARLRRIKRRHGLGMVIIDYLQLMEVGRKAGENRQQEISQISRGVKAIAKDFNVPVLALSQLSRAVEGRADHRPMLSDLRESGSIEQDADVVMFVFREEVYNPADPDLENLATLIVAKQRNGPVGEVQLMFQKDHARFYELARQ